MDLDNLIQHSIPAPSGVYTIFGSPEDFMKIPQEHKDQIFFLDEEASNFIKDFFNSSGIIGNSFFLMIFSHFR